MEANPWRSPTSEKSTTFDVTTELKGKKGSIDGDDNSELKESYLQTHRALKDALSEQAILRERLRVLESKNKPPKFGRPVQIRSIQATRGTVEDDETPPERLHFELQKAQAMLENARRAAEAAKQEQEELAMTIQTFTEKTMNETEVLVSRNAARHRSELHSEQVAFREETEKWNDERNEYLSEAERLSILAQQAVHDAAIARTEVEQQRKKIQGLAADFRRELSRAKTLRDAVDSAKMKVQLTKNLVAEIDANNQKVENLTQLINEQKTILKAVRISEQAKSVLDDLDHQVSELTDAKARADRQLTRILDEQARLKDTYIDAQGMLKRARDRFKAAQMEMLVLEAEIRDLKAEHDKQKVVAMENGRRNRELQRDIRVERMEATQRFVLENSKKIHRVDRVQTTLARVRNKLVNGRPNTATQQPRVTKKAAPKTPRRH